MARHLREPAGDETPVTVTCRVPGPARQPYYRWPAEPVGDAELEQAYRAGALFDAHRDDPEFGRRWFAHGVSSLHGGNLVTAGTLPSYPGIPSPSARIGQDL